jgi:hypothetical protein
MKEIKKENLLVTNTLRYKSSSAYLFETPGVGGKLTNIQEHSMYITITETSSHKRDRWLT